MSIKKLILFLVAIAIIIAICISTNFVARSYTGFLIDTKNKKILKTYPIKISGTYTKNKENKFNGYLLIDGEKYYLTGDTSLNNTKTSEGNLLNLSTHNKIGSKYKFSIYDNFNENDDINIYSENLDSSTLIIASNNTSTDYILDNIK